MMPDWNTGGIDLVALSVWTIAAIAAVAAGSILLRHYPRATAATIGAAALVIAGGMFVSLIGPIEAQEVGDCFCDDVDSTGNLRLGNSSASDECILFRTSPDQSICWDDEIVGVVLQSTGVRYAGWTLDAPLTVSLNPTGNKDILVWGVEGTELPSRRVSGRLSYIDANRTFDIYAFSGGTIGPGTPNRTLTLGRSGVAGHVVSILGQFNATPDTTGNVTGTYEGFLNVGTNATTGGSAVVVDDGFGNNVPLFKLLTDGSNACATWWNASAQDFSLCRTATDQLTTDAGLQLTPRSAAPFTCSSPGGGVYFDSDNDTLCCCADNDGLGFSWIECDGVLETACS